MQPKAAANEASHHLSGVFIFLLTKRMPFEDDEIMYHHRLVLAHSADTQLVSSSYTARTGTAIAAARRTCATQIEAIARGLMGDLAS